MASTNSGVKWVDWANNNAKNSNSIADLKEPFKSNVSAFISSLKEAGAKITVSSSLRDEKRAYLMHWSWKIVYGDVKPSAAKLRDDVAIIWDHGDDEKSKKAALEMVKKFRLAAPPKSNVAPSLTSNHISGYAIDMTITWSGTLKVKNKTGEIVEVPWNTNVNANKKLHEVGKSYNVIKHISDAPHWSKNGR